MQKFFPCIEKKVTKRTEKLKLSFLLSLSHILRQLLKNSMQRQALMASKCLIDFFLFKRERSISRCKTKKFFRNISQKKLEILTALHFCV